MIREAKLEGRGPNPEEGETQTDRRLYRVLEGSWGRHTSIQDLAPKWLRQSC